LLNKGENKMTQLVRFDTNSLNRALVGFDQIFDDFEHRFASQISNNYPPHNILKRTDDEYEIQIAVAGFRKDEIKLTVEDNILAVAGVKFEEHDTAEYLYKGLAARNFERYFRLEGYLEVKSAEIVDGLLVIKLERNVPEEKKPKTIDIK
jgi:molecular chaperone IbpA